MPLKEFSLKKHFATFKIVPSFLRERKEIIFEANVQIRKFQSGSAGIGHAHQGILWEQLIPSSLEEVREK